MIKMQEDLDRIGPKVLAVLMAYDAFRICLRSKPKNFTYEQVLLWMKLMK